jgi:hypothetical protein
VKPQCVPAGMASPADRDRGFSISRRGWQSTGGRHRPAESTGPDSPGGVGLLASGPPRGAPVSPFPRNKGSSRPSHPTVPGARLFPEPDCLQNHSDRGHCQAEVRVGLSDASRPTPRIQRNAMLRTHSRSSRRTVRDSSGCGASGGWRATARTFAARRCRGPPAGLESRM